MNTSTPRAGSHTRPPLRTMPMTGVLSGVIFGVARGPCVDGDDVSAVSFEDERARGGENGDESLESFGDGVLCGGVEKSPVTGDAGLLGGVPSGDVLRGEPNC